VRLLDATQAAVVGVLGAALGMSGLLAAPAVADGSTSVVHGVVSAGAAHTCAVLDAGTLRCWGKGADGRLGYGGVDNVGDGTGPSIQDAGDVPVGGPVQAVAAGEAHTCALLTAGTVRCWGNGADGRLGYGGVDDVGDGAGPSIEQQGDVPLPDKAVAVAAGATHTCAVLVTGGVDCWGAGSAPGLVDGLHDAVTITAGGHHTCVTTRAGAVQCWAVGGHPAPVRLAAGDPAVDVSAGVHHACAVLGSGLVDCWELGDTGDAGTPLAISLAAGAVAVAAGGDRTCAVLDGGAAQCWEAGGSVDGAAVASGATALAVGPEHACVLLTTKLQCWGNGADGRLGYGDTTPRPAPAAAGTPASTDATSTTSPDSRVTFGGGSQADGSRAPARPSGERDDGHPWWPWLAILVVPTAAIGGWVIWRRRSAREVTGR
jgi:alpha-tubulin suppressor-like RCC1 family protein